MCTNDCWCRAIAALFMSIIMIVIITGQLCSPVSIVSCCLDLLFDKLYVFGNAAHCAQPQSAASRSSCFLLQSTVEVWCSARERFNSRLETCADVFCQASDVSENSQPSVSVDCWQISRTVELLIVYNQRMPMLRRWLTLHMKGLKLIVHRWPWGCSIVSAASCREIDWTRDVYTQFTPCYWRT